MELKEIRQSVSLLKSYRVAEEKKEEKKDPNEPAVEGISFRYKTVQFHLLDDTFEEFKKQPEVFGDIKIYSERFSLPGFGTKLEGLDGNEYQFEVIVFIDSKTNSDRYFEALKTAMDTIEQKHGIDILVAQYESAITKSAYNVHRIVYYTTKEGIFPKE